MPDPKQLSDDAAKDFKVVVTRHMLQTVRRIFDDADNVQFVDIASAVQARPVDPGSDASDVVQNSLSTRLSRAHVCCNSYYYRYKRLSLGAR